MKKGILLLLLMSSYFANAQSLKEALYSGKLKNSPGTVIRKGDDLSKMIDTVQKVDTVVAVNTRSSAPATDTVMQTAAVQANTITAAQPDSNLTTTATTAQAEAVTESPAPASTAVAPPKDNNTAWKEYVNSLLPAINSEVLTSKKVKKESYYVLVSYSIDTTGQVAIVDVSVSPENAFLQQQIKDRLSLDAPRLSPVVSSSGAPRKVTRKYNFTLVKN